MCRSTEIRTRRFFGKCCYILLYRTKVLCRTILPSRFVLLYRVWYTAEPFHATVSYHYRTILSYHTNVSNCCPVPYSRTIPHTYLTIPSCLTTLPYGCNTDVQYYTMLPYYCVIPRNIFAGGHSVSQSVSQSVNQSVSQSHPPPPIA